MERPGGFGIEAQRDQIERWATFAQADIAEIIEDDDTSGIAEPMEREGLGRALQMLAAGEASALVVSKLDRLARGIVQFADILRLSQAEGWDLIVLDPLIDFRTAAGRAMGAMLISFADIEREAFTDRMHNGRRAAIARGSYAGGPRLHRKYGYELVRRPDGKSSYEPIAVERHTTRPGPSGIGWHRLRAPRAGLRNTRRASSRSCGL